MKLNKQLQFAMRKILCLALIAVMCMPMHISAFEVSNGNDYTNRLGISISASDYRQLLQQGLDEIDIDHLDEEAYTRYMAETDGELIVKADSYYVCSKDGRNIEVPENQAKAIASNINTGTMPVEDEAAYDSASDGVCKMTLILYKTGNSYRSTTRVIWLTIPPMEGQDVLSITHNQGLITNTRSVTTSLFFDWASPTGIMTYTDEAASITSQVGAGAVCKFNRVKYPSILNGTYTYKVEMYSSKNSSDITTATLQSDFYRGIEKLNASLSINAIAIIESVVTGSLSSIVSILPTYSKSFAEVLQSSVFYTINP